MANDWRDIVDGELDRDELRRPGRRNGIEIRFPDEHLSLVDASCRKRGISRAAFIRRAAIAFAVADFDLDWDDVMNGEAGVVPFGSVGIGDRVIDPNGQGFGPWKIEGLSGG